MIILCRQFTKWPLYLTWWCRIADSDANERTSQAHRLSFLEMGAVESK
jgi:hypothetical protein